MAQNKKTQRKFRKNNKSLKIKQKGGSYFPDAEEENRKVFDSYIFKNAGRNVLGKSIFTPMEVETGVDGVDVTKPLVCSSRTGKEYKDCEQDKYKQYQHRKDQIDSKIKDEKGTLKKINAGTCFTCIADGVTKSDTENHISKLEMEAKRIEKEIKERERKGVDVGVISGTQGQDEEGQSYDTTIQGNNGELIGVTVENRNLFTQEAEENRKKKNAKFFADFKEEKSKVGYTSSRPIVTDMRITSSKTETRPVDGKMLGSRHKAVNENISRYIRIIEEKIKGFHKSSAYREQYLRIVEKVTDEDTIKAGIKQYENEEIRSRSQRSTRQEKKGNLVRMMDELKKQRALVDDWGEEEAKKREKNSAFQRDKNHFDRDIVRVFELIQAMRNLIYIDGGLAILSGNGKSKLYKPPFKDNTNQLEAVAMELTFKILSMEWRDTEFGEKFRATGDVINSLIEGEWQDIQIKVGTIQLNNKDLVDSYIDRSLFNIIQSSQMTEDYKRDNGPDSLKFFTKDFDFKLASMKSTGGKRKTRRRLKKRHTRKIKRKH